MKTRLPYFLLALLTGTCFFSGSVEATPPTEKFSTLSKGLFSRIEAPLKAQRRVKAGPLFADAAFMPTDKGSGREEVSVKAASVEGAGNSFSIPGSVVSGRKTTHLLPYSSGSSALAKETVGVTETCCGTFQFGPSLDKKQTVSFFDSFL